MAHKFSSRLKKLLAERNISISQLSRLTNISRQSIYKWFATDNISSHSLTKLARSLAVDEDWLRYGTKGFTTREQSVNSGKNAFIKVLDNHAFNDTKQHLTELDVLIGAYHFSTGKISCYNTSTILNPAAGPVDSFEDLTSHICVQQLKRIKLNALKLLTQLRIDSFHISTVHNPHIYQCTLMPIVNQTQLLEGISFSVTKVFTEHEKLSKCLKAKCDKCINELRKEVANT
ncbi:helix-turn-helix domain-containing protein [Thalassotalea montiporae]